MTTRPATALPFEARYRVYWEDTDAGGVVFYANYLKFFERARTDWLRALGISQQALRADTGAIFIVSETSVRYLAPARLDDELRVTASLSRIGRASLVFEQKAWCGARCLSEGQIRVGCVDSGTFAPVRIPKAVLDVLLTSDPPAAAR
jgi:acyl-CoA thioester hydrolase